MKIQILIIIYSLTLLSVNKSFAHLWIGDGIAITNPNTNKEIMRNCSEIAIDFEITKTELKWNKGHYICNDLQAEYGQETFEINDGFIFNEKIKIGHYSKNVIQLDIFDPSDETTFHLKLNLLPNGTLKYNEIWKDSSQKILFKVEGILINK